MKLLLHVSDNGLWVPALWLLALLGRWPFYIALGLKSASEGHWVSAKGFSTLLFYVLTRPLCFQIFQEEGPA